MATEKMNIELKEFLSTFESGAKGKDNEFNFDYSFNPFLNLDLDNLNN